MAEIFVDALYDAVLDCMKVIPILFLAYLLVAFLSHDHSHKFSKFLSKNKKASVFYASLLGCVPQCGFSSVVADLYSSRKLSLGTLVAVFIATSDEAIPIMLSNADSIVSMLILIGLKLVLAIAWGYVIDLVIALISKRKRRVGQHCKVHCAEEAGGTFVEKHSEAFAEEHGKHHESCAHECVQESATHHHEENHQHIHSHHQCGHVHSEHCNSDCGHTHGQCCGNNILVDAFDHTFNIVIYIFVATFIINMIVGSCGTEFLESMLTENLYVQVVIASLIGLIPNCASSVLLVELFMVGSLGFPALVAGLTTGAGVGLVILWTKNKAHPVENLGIVLLQYVIGVASGMFLTLFFK